MGAKYLEAPYPQNQVYCRWCDSIWVLIAGVYMCDHCDVPHSPDGCLKCSIMSERTDTRTMGGSK